MATARFRVVAVFLFLSGCDSRNRHPSPPGDIDRSAPLVVHLEKRIAAPPATIWHLLTDIQNWPRWQPDIRATETDATPRLGTTFGWTVDAGQIRSRIVVFSPDQRLAWTGRLLWFHAVHVWTLHPTGDGGTLVHCDESLSGFLLGWFMDRADLSESDQYWLDTLDIAAAMQGRSSAQALHNRRQ